MYVSTVCQQGNKDKGCVEVNGKYSTYISTWLKTPYWTLVYRVSFSLSLLFDFFTGLILVLLSTWLQRVNLDSTPMHKISLKTLSQCFILSSH